ncbi:hypothetical protein GCM10010361_71630 [Streptomyces olivaceiscleroticus]|uniref:Uncharacterized protein n=1 Tax=Streptomyces olivaceiscleroticus TaxID=68245 RepID=A0ABP3L990_9ACTN
MIRVGSPASSSPRICNLDRALEHVVSHPGVWLTTSDEIAEHYTRHHA